MGWGNFVNNLGIATQVWKKIDQENEDRDYAKAMRKLQLERGTADNELLSPRNAALRAQYGMQTAQANSDAELIPLRGKRDRVQTEIANAKAEAEQKDIGTVLEGDAASRKANALAQKYRLGTEEYALEDLPNKLLGMRQQGAIDDAARATHVMSALHQIGLTGDPKAMVDFANRALQANPMPGFEGHTVTGVKSGQVNHNGQPVDVWEFATNNGKGGTSSFSIPKDMAKAAYDRTHPAKMESVTPGTTILSMRPGETPTKVYQADKWEKGDDGSIFNQSTGETKAVQGGGPAHLDKRMKNVMLYINKYAGANEFAGLTEDQRRIILEAGLKNARTLLEKNPDMSEAEAAEAGIRMHLRSKEMAAVRGAPGNATEPMTNDPVDKAASKFKF